MTKITDRERTAKIMSLHKRGYSNAKIAEEINMIRTSIYRIVKRETEREKKGLPTREEYIKSIIEARKVMHLDEVAKKFGLTQSCVSNLTRKHPDTKLFKRRTREYTRKPKSLKEEKPKMTKKSKPKVFPKKEIKKPVIIPKTKPKKTEAKQIIPAIQSNEMMQKGHVKLQKNETVLPSRIRKAQRSIPIYDSKNTLIFVDEDDPRSNEIIRQEYLSKKAS